MSRTTSLDLSNLSMANSVEPIGHAIDALDDTGVAQLFASKMMSGRSDGSACILAMGILSARYGCGPEDAIAVAWKLYRESRPARCREPA